MRYFFFGIRTTFRLLGLVSLKELIWIIIIYLYSDMPLALLKIARVQTSWASIFSLYLLIYIYRYIDIDIRVVFKTLVKTTFSIFTKNSIYKGKFSPETSSLKINVFKICIIYMKSAWHLISRFFIYKLYIINTYRYIYFVLLYFVLNFVLKCIPLFIFI